MLHHLHPRKDGYTDQSLYPYDPSETAALAFTALFATAGALHIILMFPYRAWFPIPMIIGAAMEAGSYYLRSQSHNNTHQILPFILSTLLIMGAAPMLAATIYMSLKRVATALDAAHYAPVSLRWVSKLFVLVDIGCFVSQIAGSAMRADVGTLQTGTTLVMAGLVTQVVIFGVYVGVVAVVHVRLERSPTRVSGREGLLPWRRVVWGLYCVSALFLVRNLVRIAEFKQGDKGWLVSSEVPLYVFDGGFMLVIVVVMAVVHPGRLMRRVSKLGKEGSFELDSRGSEREPLAG